MRGTGSENAGGLRMGSDPLGSRGAGQAKKNPWKNAVADKGSENIKSPGWLLQNSQNLLEGSCSPGFPPPFFPLQPHKGKQELEAEVSSLSRPSGRVTAVTDGPSLRSLQVLPGHLGTAGSWDFPARPGSRAAALPLDLPWPGAGSCPPKWIFPGVFPIINKCQAPEQGKSLGCCLIGLNRWGHPPGMALISLLGGDEGTEVTDGDRGDGTGKMGQA